MTTTSQDVDFIVRTEGKWWHVPVPARDPVEVSIDHVLRLLGLDMRPIEGGAATMVHLARPVRPARIVAGLVCRSGLLVEDAHGAEVHLDANDLRLLNDLTESTPALSNTSELSVAEAQIRVERLISVGAARPANLESSSDATGPVDSSFVHDVEREQVPPPPDEVPSIAPSLDRRPRLARLLRRRGYNEERIPVYSVWLPSIGPMLSQGMLLATLRHHRDGALSEHFELRKIETEAEMLNDLAHRSTSAILLCSDYVWSTEENLRIAHEARRLCPQLVVVHGGPSSPKFPLDAERFLEIHRDVAHVLVRGEGEAVLCQLMDVLSADSTLDGDNLGSVSGLDRVPGITFRRVDGSIVRNPDQERIAELDSIPSPYLTGEFDHIPPEAWQYSLSLETNRGCPYSCSFCDWGSATQSRIRYFDLDRVTAEIDWAASRGLLGIQICDANFGIRKHDVQIAERLSGIARRAGFPKVVSFTPAKNTTKHIVPIIDSFIDAGVLMSMAISLQTTDRDTLAAVQRENISTDGYLKLAAELRRRHVALLGDLLIGLPGQTYEAYKRDLQFFIDHEIAPRSWSLRALPNAPMNAPEYREAWRIEVGEDTIVTSTSTMTATDRDHMLALRKAQVIADQFSVLTPVMRVMQWDREVSATDLLEQIILVTTETPTRFPAMTWVFAYFDLYLAAAIGWSRFGSELWQLLQEDFDIGEDDESVRTAVKLGTFLLPRTGRQFPASIPLAHDFASYYRSGSASLYESGHAGVPTVPLSEHPPAEFVVESDPLDLCGDGLHLPGDSRDESMLGNFWIGLGGTYELLSPLTRVAPEFRDPNAAGQSVLA